MRVTTVDDRCRPLFFQHVFDDFDFFDFSEKRYWAKSLGKHFGSSGGVREGFLEHPGEVQEASWGVLRLSGASGGSLGRVLGALGAILERPFEQFNFGSIFLSILVAKRVPKGRHLGTQNGAQDDQKSIKK